MQHTVYLRIKRDVPFIQVSDFVVVAQKFNINEDIFLKCSWIVGRYGLCAVL